MMITRAARKNIVQLLSLVCMLGGSLSASNSFWLWLSNGDVYQQWDLRASLDQCFFPMPLVGSYCLWNDAWKISTYGSFSVTAKATNDIHIGISKIDPSLVKPSGIPYAELVSADNLYEIVIGGWSNTRTVIRKGSQGAEIAAVAGGIPSNPDTGLGVDVLIKYKVILYQNSRTLNNTIAVFYRYLTNRRWTLLISYEDSEFITATQRWCSLSTWDNPIFYEHIRVSNETELPPVR